MNHTQPIVALIRPKRIQRTFAYTNYLPYIPPKSVQVNFLWGKNDVRTAIEHEDEVLYRPKNFIPPPPKKTNFWLYAPDCKYGKRLSKMYYAHVITAFTAKFDSLNFIR